MPSPNPRFKIKRSNPFRADCVLTDDFGEPRTLVGATIFSQVRRLGGSLVADLDVVPKAGELGGFALTASTDNWPPELLAWDIRVELGGEQDTNSETVYFLVERPITLELPE